MTNLQLILTLARQIVPAAMELKELLDRPPEEQVDPETLARLREVNDRPFEYYETPRDP